MCAAIVGNRFSLMLAAGTSGTTCLANSLVIVNTLSYCRNPYGSPLGISENDTFPTGSLAGI